MMDWSERQVLSLSKFTIKAVSGVSEEICVFIRVELCNALAAARSSASRIRGVARFHACWPKRSFLGIRSYSIPKVGLAISATGQGYASAVRQLGAAPSRIYLRHILPNIASTLIISMTVVFPEVSCSNPGYPFSVSGCSRR